MAGVSGSLRGIVIDAAHNLWGVANKRNAIVFVQSGGFALDVFRGLPLPRR